MRSIMWFPCIGLAATLCIPALAQPFEFTIRSTGPSRSSMTSAFTGNAAFSGTFIGNYNQVSNPTGTRTLDFNFQGTRPPAPTNITKTLSGTGNSSGNAVGVPVGTYAITIHDASVSLTGLTANLIGAATQTPSPVNSTVTYQSFLSAAPNNSYPFLFPLGMELGSASVTRLDVLQTAMAISVITPGPNGSFIFSFDVEADVTTTVEFQGSPTTQTQALMLPVTGSITPSTNTATATLTISIDLSSGSTTPQPQPPNQPFDLPPPTGSGEPAHLLLSLTINSQSTSINGSATLPADGVLAGPSCGTADFDGDGDFATDADIEAFFRCLAGNCCQTCWPLGADFNADGDVATDADIESFFRVLAGHPC